MISLIIPCFNEEESLPLFYPEATSVLRQMNCDYELIFVNDGSRDRTLEIFKRAFRKGSSCDLSLLFPETLERKLPCMQASAMPAAIM